MKKPLSIILATVMLLSLLPATVFAAETFSDTSGHWAEAAIETWAVHGVLLGSGGEFRPNAPITRAELAAVLNRVMGYTATTDAAFTDVTDGEWYATDIAKVYAAGIMLGDGDGVMRPTENITREETAVMSARAFAVLLAIVEGDVPGGAPDPEAFPDHNSIASWAIGEVYGMKAAGYIHGDQDGKFNPKANITRAEVVTMLANIVDYFYNAPGEYDNVGISFTPRNVVIRSTGVKLKNSAITGNLYITEGVADGDVTLDNVTVSGTTYVRGGGANSIHIIGGSFSAIILDSGDNTHIDITGTTGIDRVYINNTGSVTHSGMTVTYSAATGTLTFGGALDVVELNADGTATVTVGGVKYDVIPPEGTISKFELAPGSVVKQMITNGAVNVTGEGKIDKLTVHDDGVVIDKSVDVEPENITVDDGVKINVADKDYTGDGKTLPPNAPPSNDGSGGGSRPKPTTYSVTLNRIDGQDNDDTYGTLSIEQGNQTGNAQGATVAVKATPKPGYNFVSWVDGNNRTADVVSTANPYSFTITADTNLYAIFTHDGTDPANPTEIATEAELAAIGTDTASLGRHYKLLNDITLTSTWTPIGSSTDQFTGTFDGGGHTITFDADVGTVADGSSYCAGLFDNIGADGKVSNLTVDGDISVTATSDSTYIGGIAGYNWGTIENCAMLGSVSASGGMDNRAGGIAGISGSGATIKNCFSVGNVSTGGSGIYTNEAGGIAGRDDGTTSNCYSTGNITASGGSSSNYAGGIAGLSTTAPITNCYATGAVSASGGTLTYAGGITGFSSVSAGNDIVNCVALNSGVSAIDGNTIYLGRIVGQSSGIRGGNRAIAISGFTTTDVGADKKDGATIGTGDVVGLQDFWETTQTWSFGDTDTAPWKIATSGYTLPTLYWQTDAPSLPTHFPTGASTASPITISTAAGLAAIADGLDKHYKLTANITVSGWTPIGSTSANAFTGSLNGNGYTVIIGGIASGLAVETISGGNYTYVGLFGYIGTGGVVERLAVTGTVEYSGSANSSTYRLGGIAGCNSGTIKNCYTTAAVSGTANGSQNSGTNVYAGGIVGENIDGGVIENCYARGNVSATASVNKYVGGIAGGSDSVGTVRNCVALNSGFSTSGSGTIHIRRVVATVYSGTLTSNYGSTDMKKDGSSGSWGNDANGLDGAHCDANPDETSFWKVASTWNTTDGTAWDFDNIWEMGDDYPEFK